MNEEKFKKRQKQNCEKMKWISTAHLFKWTEVKGDCKGRNCETY